jgi:pimeloyl-ACP methyl ester carboxylesterase
MLEVIDKGSCSAAHPVPLLFVHDGWHAVWCWDHFLNFFTDAGYRAVALSLRGHGASPSAKRFHACSIADYVDDVRARAESLGGHPVLIAHSLGGFVVQRYLENRDAPAAVLVASVPPQGVLGLAVRVWTRHPWISLRSLPVGNLAGFISTPPLVREHLFCAHTPDDIVESCAADVQSEALRASLVDPLIRRVKSGRITTPVLVLGAEDDGLVSNAEVRATARAYQTEAEFFPNMGHNMISNRDGPKSPNEFTRGLKPATLRTKHDNALEPKSLLRRKALQLGKSRARPPRRRRAYPVRPTGVPRSSLARLNRAGQPAWQRRLGSAMQCRKRHPPSTPPW